MSILNNTKSVVGPKLPSCCGRNRDVVCAERERNTRSTKILHGMSNIDRLNRTTSCQDNRANSITRSKFYRTCQFRLAANTNRPDVRVSRKLSKYFARQFRRKAKSVRLQVSGLHTEPSGFDRISFVDHVSSIMRDLCFFFNKISNVRLNDSLRPIVYSELSQSRDGCLILSGGKNFMILRRCFFFLRTLVYIKILLRS